MNKMVESLRVGADHPGQQRGGGVSRASLFALVGRLTQATIPKTARRRVAETGRLQVFVDDPIFVIRGRRIVYRELVLTSPSAEHPRNQRQCE